MHKFLYCCYYYCYCYYFLVATIIVIVTVVIIVIVTVTVVIVVEFFTKTKYEICVLVFFICPTRSVHLTETEIWVDQNPFYQVMS